MSDIILEAKRCLKCKNATCREGCPVHTNIPLIMSYFLDGKVEEAGELLFDNNPLSALCSYICPHEQTCMGHCILNKTASPIRFYEVEQYISTFYLEKSHIKKPEPNGFNIAIIGAGPAGLTLAFQLAKIGYSVNIIDSKDKIGGVLRYGIPEFRLPKVLLDKLLARMNDLNISFRPNTLIGPTITIDDMFRDGYHAIFIGTGVWRPNLLRIPGEALGNVHFAIDFLKNPEAYTQLGPNVIVIGAGNVAMDVSRTIVRKLNTSVSIIFNRGENDVTCLKEELNLALIDGVKMNYYLETKAIEKDGIIVEPVERIEKDGIVTFVSDPSKAYKIPSTSVIIAIGQGPLSNIVNNNKNIETNKKGLIEATTLGHTTRDGVFAAGDVVSGAKTVASAVAASKVVAAEIDAYVKHKYGNK